LEPFLERPAILPGAARQLVEGHNPLDLGAPARSVLEPIDDSFNATFAAGSDQQVPIEFVDLSGYGASCVSNWVNDPGDGPAITNVRFEVLNGRTRYEVIRMRSKLIPCDAVVIRTITLERRASGAVFRWDSGWVAITDGLFEWPGDKVRFHTGAVRGFYKIREIRDTRGTITLAGVPGAAVEAVYFDADISVDHVVRGATSGDRIPALSQLGFVQLVPFGAQSPLHVDPLTAAQLLELLQRYNPVGGNVDCVVNIGGSGQQMRVTGIFSSVALNDAGKPEFVVACYGSPMLLRREQWTMSRVSTANGEVSAVDVHRGVPLIRGGGSPNVPAFGPYRIAEPEDLLRSNAATAYALQLTTETNRLLFLNPQINPGKNAIMGSDRPIMADPFAQVGQGGLFPPLGRCLQLEPPGYLLNILPDGYQWPSPQTAFKIPDLGNDLKRFLIKNGSFDLRADYAGKLVRIVADSAKPWSINLPKIPSVLDVHTPDLGKDILQVVSDMYSPGAEGQSPPQILYGAALKTASDLMTIFQAFTADGLPPLEIKLSPPTLEDPALHLHIGARFPIANKDGSAIDVGIGKFRGEFGVGTDIQLGLQGFGGRIYFNGMGELQQPLLPKLLYVGGSLFVEISINESGTPALRLITSAVGSVGGDLIPGLVSVEGAVSYGYFLDTSIDPFMPGVALGMEVRAKLLSGLVGVRFRGDVTVGVMPVGVMPDLPFPRNLVIAGQFTAHLSVIGFYVFERDFDKTLRFEQKIPGVIAAGIAVYTGLVPLPV
jgi:hypothetical protein